MMKVKYRYIESTKSKTQMQDLVRFLSEQGKRNETAEERGKKEDESRAVLSSQ